MGSSFPGLIFTHVGRSAPYGRRKVSSWLTAFAIAYLFNAQFVVTYEATTNLIYYGTLGVLVGLKEPWADEKAPGT